MESNLEQADHRMTTMREEQTGIAKLGPIGILREGLEVYRADAKVYILIQLTLMLPLAILALGLSYIIVSNMPVPPNLNGQSPGPGRNVPDFPMLEPMVILFDPDLLQLHPVLVLLAGSAFSFVFQIALSLAQSTSLYSLGLHYAGQPIAYLDVLSAAMPRLWMRMAVTNTWSSVTGLFLNWVGTLCVLNFGFPLGVCLWFAVSKVGGYVRAMIFTITPGVSVLEEDYGWAAVWKSMKLLMEQRIQVAIWFSLLFMVPKFDGLFWGMYVVENMNEGDCTGWAGAQLLLITLFYLAWTTTAWQVEFLCWGVLYVSFKAYHGESLADPLSQNMNGGSVAVGDGSIDDGGLVTAEDGSSKAMLYGKQTGAILV